MAHRFVGRLLVLVHTDEDPSSDEWSAFIADCHARMGEFRGFLIVTGGGSLDAGQRSDAIDLMKKSGASASVLTSAAVVRGAVTAVSWFGAKVKAFPPSHLHEALAYARVAEEDRNAAYRAVQELAQSLPGAQQSIPPAP